MEDLILGIYTLVHGFCFFKLFLIGCIGYVKVILVSECKVLI